MDPNLKIPLSTLTNQLSSTAKRTVTRADKHYLFGIVEGLAGVIAKGQPGFDREEFLTECGVSPDWATIAA